MKMYRVPVYEGLTPLVLCRWLVDNCEVSGSTQMVMMALSLMSGSNDPITDGIYATQADLARYARVSPSSVKSAVRWMRGSGQWVVIPGTGGRPATEGGAGDDGRANAYYPVLRAGALPEGVRLVAERMIAVGTARREIIAQREA